MQDPMAMGTPSGPEYDALRAALATFGGEFAGADRATWQLAGGDGKGVVFLARTGRQDGFVWWSVEVSSVPGGWSADGMGECQPRVVLSPELGSASWTPDPSFPTPGAEATEIHVLVSERACSSGKPPAGRIGAPVVQYAPDTVTITFGVRPLGGSQDCPGVAGSPATVTLDEPLGSRVLLDGGVMPPAPPADLGP